MALFEDFESFLLSDSVGKMEVLWSESLPDPSLLAHCALNAHRLVLAHMWAMSYFDSIKSSAQCPRAAMVERPRGRMDLNAVCPGGRHVSSTQPAIMRIKFGVKPFTPKASHFHF